VGAVGILVLRTGVAAPVDAGEPLEAFFPLVARRPVIEREIEIRGVHEASRDGRETVTSMAIEGPILPRWGVSLTMPLAFGDPRAGASTAGAGDLELESKVIFSASADGRALAAAGLGLTLPTGSERRGLGGQTALEPFAVVGLAAGDLLIVSDFGYVMTIAGPHRDERRIHGTLALAHPVGQRLLPLLALTAASTLENRNGRAVSQRGRLELYVTPGMNVRVLPRATLGFGVQVPVTGTRVLDHAFFVTIDWDL
jgi:hypothetical protein